MEEEREWKRNWEAVNVANGYGLIDIDFQELLEENKLTSDRWWPFTINNSVRTYCCVRKWILFEKESKDGQIDCVSVANPVIRVCEPKYKVDGITKFIENNDFVFDYTFGEEDRTETIYDNAVKPTLDQIFKQGISTVFAYGQTGSGKTYTMEGI